MRPPDRTIELGVGTPTSFAVAGDSLWYAWGGSDAINRFIDETYGRTLRVENPDDASVEAEIWINETQTDLYGYREGLSE